MEKPCRHLEADVLSVIPGCSLTLPNRANSYSIFARRDARPSCVAGDDVNTLN
jgi:hypothetical protein